MLPGQGGSSTDARPAMPSRPCPGSEASQMGPPPRSAGTKIGSYRSSSPKPIQDPRGHLVQPRGVGSVPPTGANRPSSSSDMGNRPGSSADAQPQPPPPAPKQSPRGRDSGKSNKIVPVENGNMTKGVSTSRSRGILKRSRHAKSLLARNGGHPLAMKDPASARYHPPVGIFRGSRRVGQWLSRDGPGHPHTSRQGSSRTLQNRRRADARSSKLSIVLPSCSAPVSSNTHLR